MSILCATDFSPCSRAALDLAAVMARRLGDSLFLLHVVEVPPLALPEVPIGPSPWELALQQAATERLARLAKEVSQTGIAVETRVLMGDAGGLVPDTARELRPRLIVVGTHGRKGPALLFLGSVAEHVVRAASCPVLVTRAGTDLDHWQGPAPLRLAFAADGSSSGRAAFLGMTNLLEQVATETTVVRLYWPPHEAYRYGVEHPWLGDQGHPDLVNLLARDLQRDLPTLSRPGAPPVRFRAVERHVTEALIAEAATLQADVIVVGTSRQHPAQAAISAIEVLRAASVPVLCVPGVGVPVSKTIRPVRSIMVAMDLTRVSSEALAPAYGLLSAGGGRIELCHVHVRERTDDLMDLSLSAPLTNAERAEVESRVRALVPPEAASLGISTGVSVVEGLSPEEGLLQAAARLDVDLIALASHGRSGLKRVVLGSVAEDIARRSSLPVLIIHASARA